MEKEKFNAFEGKRYEDYDDKFMKDIIFKKKKFAKCNHCKKKIDYKTSFYGFNRLLCKKCYKDLDKSNHEAVSGMMDRIFDEDSKDDEIVKLKRKVARLNYEIKKLNKSGVNKNG